jgi:hypothetical protein
MNWNKIRSFENMHILIWLVKDTCWVLDFKGLGVAAIFPAVGMAVYIALLTRKSPREFWHNLAVCAWILANSIWMVGEFFFSDATRPWALLFFITGFLCIGFYYLFLKHRIPEPAAD